MNLLLDTHVFLWSLQNGPFSQPARTAFVNRNNNLFLSVASYWEICIKVSIGKLILAEGWKQQFEVEMFRHEIQWLAIEPFHCYKLLELPTIHQDPFDRLLIAQALCEKMVILTNDRYIPHYPVLTLW